MSKEHHGGLNLHFDEDAEAGFRHVEKHYPSDSTKMKELKEKIENLKEGEKMNFETGNEHDNHFRFRKDSDGIVRIEKRDSY